MKKLVLTLLLVAACGASAFAQKGMNGIGVNVPVSVGQGTTAFGIGVKYHYNISNYFRLEPSCEFLPIHTEDKNGEYDFPKLKAFLNANLFLGSPSPARPYIIAGLGYVFYSMAEDEPNLYYDAEYTMTDDGFNCNIGLGYDFRLSHSLSMQLEATEMNCIAGGFGEDWRKHTGKWTFIGRIGLTYNF